MTRWRGLVELVRDAVHHGSGAVEKVHLRVVLTPLELAARIPLRVFAKRQECAA